MAREDLRKKYEEKRRTAGLDEQWGRGGATCAWCRNTPCTRHGRGAGPGRRQGARQARRARICARTRSSLHQRQRRTLDQRRLADVESPAARRQGWLYEGGIREPLLVRWPGVVKPGSVMSTPVSSPDFFPTLLEAAGVQPSTWRGHLTA
jgi:arylsulfatase A-like enzyme